MRIKREFAQSEIADLLDEAIEVDSAPWRHGRKVTYVFSEVQDECPSNDGAQGPFWRCTLDVHHEEGMRLYGPVTCARVEQKQVMTTQWVAVDAKEDGQGLRIAATAAERRWDMAKEKRKTSRRNETLQEWWDRGGFADGPEVIESWARRTRGPKRAALLTLAWAEDGANRAYNSVTDLLGGPS